MAMATRRCSYTAAFKLKLVEYAERHGSAGREFDICEKLIRDWRKNKLNYNLCLVCVDRNDLE